MQGLGSVVFVLNFFPNKGEKPEVALEPGLASTILITARCSRSEGDHIGGGCWEL